MFNEIIGVESFKADNGLIGYRKVFDTSFVKPLTGTEKQISYAEDIRSGFVKALKYTAKTLRDGADAYLKEGAEFDPKSASNKCAAAALYKPAKDAVLPKEGVADFAYFLAQLDTPALLHDINRGWLTGHPGESWIATISFMMLLETANEYRMPEGTMSTFGYEYLAYLAPKKYGHFHKTYKDVKPREFNPAKPKTKHIIKEEI